VIYVDWYGTTGDFFASGIGDGVGQLVWSGAAPCPIGDVYGSFFVRIMGVICRHQVALSGVD
jgi:hypothetical protein